MKFDIMTILSLLITLAVCGFFYYRMIIREIPKPISLINALVPICGGMATFEISGLTGIMLYMINEPVRTALAKLPAVLESLLSAFFIRRYAGRNIQGDRAHHHDRDLQA